MKCAHCGSENSPNAKFCRGCGNKCEVIEPTIPENIAACPKCGYANEAGKKFCLKCGSPAVAVPAYISEVIAPAAPTTPTATTTQAAVIPPAPPIAVSPPPAPPPALQISAEPPAPAVPSPHHVEVPPATENPGRTKLAIRAAIAVILLGTLGGGGYWYSKKQEADRVIALQKQQEEELRAKTAVAAAEAKAEETRQLAVKAARLEAERKAQVEQKRLQAQLQQQRDELERQKRANLELQEQQRRNQAAQVTRNTDGKVRSPDEIVEGSLPIVLLDGKPVLRTSANQVMLTWRGLSHLDDPVYGVGAAIDNKSVLVGRTFDIQQGKVRRKDGKWISVSKITAVVPFPSGDHEISFLVRNRNGWSSPVKVSVNLNSLQ